MLIVESAQSYLTLLVNFRSRDASYAELHSCRNGLGEKYLPNEWRCRERYRAYQVGTTRQMPVVGLVA